MRKLMACLVALVATTAANAAPIVFNYNGPPNGSFANVSVSNGGYTLNATPVVSGPPAGLTLNRDPNGLGVGFNGDADPTQVDANGGAESINFAFSSGSGTLESITFFTSGLGTGSSIEDFALFVNGVSVALGSLATINPTGAGGVFTISLASLPAALRTGNNFRISAPNDGNDFQIQALAITPTPEPISIVVFGGLIVGGAGIALRRRMATKATA